MHDIQHTNTTIQDRHADWQTDHLPTYDVHNVYHQYIPIPMNSVAFMKICQMTNTNEIYIWTNKLGEVLGENETPLSDILIILFGPHKGKVVCP